MLWKIRPLEKAEAIKDCWDFFSFLDQMALRWFQGHHRYGEPHRRKKYLTRLKMELQQYEKTGNKEHLVNVANYAYLEGKCPELLGSHWNPLAESATRGKL